MAAPLIRSAQPSDETAWRRLWNAYRQEVGALAGEEMARRTWTRILDPDSAIMCIVAEVDGQIYGLAHFVVHEDTREMQAVCCVQDLYVVTSARARGIGSALIDWLCNAMRAEGWAQVYWHTREDNELARKLSGRFAAPERQCRYVIRPR
jgi:GNAT superfamily N-acetyltransferase